MTKEAYFEACDMLGEEPDPEQIPVEFDELPTQVQRALEIYGYLADRWEGMSATYMGKDYSIVFELFSVYEITDKPEQQLMLRLMAIVDGLRSNLIQTKQKQKEKPSK